MTAATAGESGSTVPSGQVRSVSASLRHDFSKQPLPVVSLVAGLGVEGDTHSGTTVQHRSRAARDPSQPNLRQVHLIHAELFDEVAGAAHHVRPGDLGENVTTTGVDLLALPVDTLLHLGNAAVVRITGLRNPCRQIDAFDKGLLALMLDRAADGSVVRKAGVMAVVERSGQVRPGDPVLVVLPAPPHRPLSPV